MIATFCTFFISLEKRWRKEKFLKQEYNLIIKLPCSLFLSLRITGKLTRNPKSCSVKEGSDGHQLQQHMTPKDVADEIMRQFEYCLPHSHGESELHNVAFCGDVLRLRLLLEYIDSHPSKLSTLNQRNRLGCTPIRLAATGNKIYQNISLSPLGPMVLCSAYRKLPPTGHFSGNRKTTQIAFKRFEGILTRLVLSSRTATNNYVNL